MSRCGGSTTITIFLKVPNLLTLVIKYSFVFPMAGLIDLICSHATVNSGVAKVT